MENDTESTKNTEYGSPLKTTHSVPGPPLPLGKISTKSVQNVLSNPADKQTDRQTNVVSSLAEVIKHMQIAGVLHFFVVGDFV